jgi:acetyltransferase-like isoleucine patch superfamily enzyme
MRKLERDSLPHLVHCLVRMTGRQWHTFWSRLIAAWWGVALGRSCFFSGLPCFRRHPGSTITIGDNCEFLSTHTANLIGINRPCIISTLAKGATIEIGANCGFSGTVIGCATRIVLGDNVRCGANTLITDTDWHTNDPRTSSDAPVIIGENVWLGFNVTVLKGVMIGENTLVATGSVVTKSLPTNVLAAGTPAKPVRTFDPAVKEQRSLGGLSV